MTLSESQKSLDYTLACGLRRCAERSLLPSQTRRVVEKAKSLSFIPRCQEKQPDDCGKRLDARRT
jgi:hypothetical protein